MVKIAGKCCVVIGGTRCIGLEICRELLCRNIERLCIVDIDVDVTLIEKLKKEFPGKLIIWKKCDLTDRTDVERCLKCVRDELKVIHILINALEVLDDCRVEDTLKINVLGVTNVCLTALTVMGKDNGGVGGCVINLGSVCGIGRCHFLPIYTASKHAICGLTRCLADDFYLRKTGIKFMLVCHGLTLTKLFDKLSDRLIIRDLKTVVDTRLTKCIWQKVDTVVKCVTKVIDDDRNGCCVICDCNKIKDICLTDITRDFVTCDL